MESEKLLQDFGLRKTQPRSKMLSLFMERGHALSVNDLITALPEIDRATVYRSLETLLEAGALHKVPDDEVSAKYALAGTTEASAPAAKIANRQHAHFKCEQCGRTVCLREIPLPDVETPEGYQIESLEILARGICADCRAAA